MKSQKKLIIFVCSAIALVFFGILFFTGSNEDGSSKNSFKIDIPERQTGEKDAYLYFTDPENAFLKAEKHKIPFNTNTSKYGQELIVQLLKGPLNNEFMSPIPENTKLLSFYIDNNETAVLDFSAEIRENHPGGSQAEILTIYSIVNTITLNIEEIKSVKILINGNESDTLAGHIALRFPLKENLTIVK